MKRMELYSFRQSGIPDVALRSYFGEMVEANRNENVNVIVGLRILYKRPAIPTRDSYHSGGGR